MYCTPGKDYSWEYCEGQYEKLGIEAAYERIIIHAVLEEWRHLATTAVNLQDTSLNASMLSSIITDDNSVTIINDNDAIDLL